MAATKYTFSIANDFPNHKVATDKLSQEIKLSAIIIALDYINTSGDDCDTWFKDELSEGDQSVLATVVGNHDGEPLPQNVPQDVNIKTSSITVPSQEKGFQDLSGHNVYRFGKLLYTAKAGKTTIYMEKFTAVMYIQGGGIHTPEFVYVYGVKTENKPEWGDYCVFDMVDVDNVLGFGKTATISKISRSNNVATVTTAAANSFVVGEKVVVNADDNTFDDMEVAIASVPDNTHFTYVNTGDDVAEKSATGPVGKIVVLAPFVPRDYVSPKMTWECLCSDAKAVPPGIYLRFRYVSLGSTDVYVMPHFQLRT